MVTWPVPLVVNVTVSPPGPAATAELTVSVRAPFTDNVAVAGLSESAGGVCTVRSVEADTVVG